MSLRQVLALSLAEASEAEARRSETSRENSPDAMELGRRSAGLAAAQRQQQARERAEARALAHAQSKGSSKGKGKERLSDVSELELDDADDESELSSLSDPDEDAAMDQGGAGGLALGRELEKAEERVMRAELAEARRRARKGRDEDETDEGTDDDGLAVAWDRNVQAMERIRRRRASGGAAAAAASAASAGGDVSLEGVSATLDDDGDDSDLAVTDLPPGNGFGVVTWSDYEFDEEDDDDDDEDEDDEDQLAAALAASTAGVGELPGADAPLGFDDDGEEEDDNIAGSFEDELEQLFALSEAVVGPIQHDSVDLGDMWLAALTDVDAEDDSQADDYDDESGSGTDDVDAEMMFGPSGELTRLFGRGKKRRRPVQESSAGESDDQDDDDATDSDVSLADFGGADELDLVRLGAALDDADRRKRARTGGENGAAAAVVGDDEDETMSESVTEDEQTDSSCSDTDIYRYAPRTGALSAVQAPTTADLASLQADTPEPPQPAPTSKAAAAAAKRKGKGKASLPAIPENGSARAHTPRPPPAAAAAVPTIRKPPHARRGPIMGSFEPSAPKDDDDKTANGVKVVVIDDSGVPAPSPFAVQKKPRRRAVRPPPLPLAPLHRD